MIEYSKDFLLNIFFIFSPLVFYPYILRVKGNVLMHRFLLSVLLSVALVCTMSFPVHIHGVAYDFRSIPLTVAFLYGGAGVSLLLYIVLFICRYEMGNPNNWLYICSLAPTYFVIVPFLRRYNFLKLYQKVIMAMLICTLIKLGGIALYLTFTGKLLLLYRNPLPTFETYLLQGLIAGTYVCLLEYVNKYFVMQEEIVTSEKVKIVSDIAASVAHEIRNPLTSVRGFIQLMATEDLNQQRRDYYRKICLDELDRAQMIITDYLSLAKPDPEEMEMMHLQEEVEYVSNILLTYANFNNVLIRTQLSGFASIEGDRYKLRQALINIGKNGIEAMTAGGVLEINLDKVNDTAILTIRDTGIGMTREQINRLGTPYYSTKEKGTGLGTMVSFGIIKKMAGKIEIISEPGKGTEYQIFFAT
jgi:two-component system sporulation sensor kinase B